MREIITHLDHHAIRDLIAKSIFEHAGVELGYVPFSPFGSMPNSRICCNKVGCNLDPSQPFIDVYFFNKKYAKLFGKAFSVALCQTRSPQLSPHYFDRASINSII